MTKKNRSDLGPRPKGRNRKRRSSTMHLPAELKHFKETTLNHAILMGRVTFDGMGRRFITRS